MNSFTLIPACRIERIETASIDRRKAGTTEPGAAETEPPVTIIAFEFCSGTGRKLGALARRINSVDRVIPDIGIQIHLILIAHRIGLQEPPQRRRVDPRLVIIHAELGQPDLAGILEPAVIGRARYAVFVVGVDRREIALGVGQAGDRALLVRVEPAHGAGGVPDQRIVGAGIVAVDVDVGEAGREIFGDQRVAVVEEPGPAGGAGHLVEPAQRVVAQTDAAGAGDQAVLDIIGEAAGAVRGEVAVGVVGRRGGGTQACAMRGRRRLLRLRALSP